MEVIKSLIFDFDNTIAKNIESTDLEILNIVKKWNKNKTDDFLIKVIKNATTDYQICEELIPFEEIEKSYQKILDLNLRKVKKVFYSPIFIELLLDLSSRFDLYIISGRDNRSLEFSLKEQGIYSYFTEVIGSDSGFKPKPSYEALVYLSEKYNIPTDHIVYIGDSKTDYEMAKKIKCKFIGVSWYGRSNIEGDNRYFCKTFSSFLEKLEIILD